MEYYKTGKQLLDEENFEAAEQQFQAGAETGDVKCIYGLLAVCAMTGRDRTSALNDLQKSFHFLQDTANNGDADACFILGRCYETGSGVAASIENAMKYYSRAAMKNNLDAIFNLGCIYSASENTWEMALKCFESAAAKGHKEAKTTLRDYYEIDIIKE